MKPITATFRVRSVNNTRYTVCIMQYIITGKLPATTVYDAHTVVLLTKCRLQGSNIQTDDHILLITFCHVVNTFDASEVTTLWSVTNAFIIIIIILLVVVVIRSSAVNDESMNAIQLILHRFSSTMKPRK